MNTGRYAAGSRPRFGVRLIGAPDPAQDIADLLAGQVLRVSARLADDGRLRSGELVLALGADEPVVWLGRRAGEPRALPAPLRVVRDEPPRGRRALLLGTFAYRVLTVRTGRETEAPVTLAVPVLDTALVRRACEEASDSD